jgi:adenine-specific DNA glycosylase
MDLGSGVCTPQTPNCSGCPVRSLCKTAALCSTATAGTADATADSSSSKATTNNSSSMSSSDNSGDDGSSGCTCTVCEKDDEGCVSLPTAVTDFPRKAEKAAAKNEVHYKHMLHEYTNKPSFGLSGGYKAHHMGCAAAVSTGQ